MIYKENKNHHYIYMLLGILLFLSAITFIAWAESAYALAGPCAAISIGIGIYFMGFEHGHDGMQSSTEKET